MKPLILRTIPNDDGVTEVHVGTADYGSAAVHVAPGMENHPDIGALYEHVQNLGTTAYTAVRKSRRDEQRGK